MGMTLTDRQRDCLLMLQTSIRETGQAPSYDEMCRGLGINSKSSVMRLLKALESRGYIKRQKGKHRAIELLMGLPFDQGDRPEIAAGLRRMADRLEGGAQ